jgi:hypothetical protein
MLLLPPSPAVCKIQRAPISLPSMSSILRRSIKAVGEVRERRCWRCPEQTPTFTNGHAASTGKPIPPSPSMQTNSHQGSVPSTCSCASPPPSSVATTMKRPLSPGPDDVDPKLEKKRLKMEIPTRTSLPVSASSFTTIPDPTVISFTREQAGRELQTPALSIKPQLSLVLPLPPRPIGTGLSHAPNMLAWSCSYCNALTHINFAVTCS